MNILNKLNPLRLLATVCLFVAFALQLSAQEKLKTDSITFRFYSGRDMFYVPVLNNGTELTKLFDLVDKYKEKIDAYKILLRVEGFYVPNGPKPNTRATAKTRSNRVKSELIVKKGLTENHFVTSNEVGVANFVRISFFTVDEDGTLADEPEEVLVITEPVTEEPVVEPVPVEVPEEVTEIEPEIETIEEVLPDATVVDGPELMKEEKGDSRFALKTNLLGYAILMPNIELEYKFANRWSAALEWQGAWYSKTPPHKVYRVTTVIPEVRYWAIERSRWHGMYVGAFAGWGMYDLCDGKKGHEGEGYLGGLSVGYMWPVGKHLSLDAAIGVGYMHTRDKVYLPENGHYLYQLTKNFNYFGPLRAKLSLVWRFQCR